VPRHVSLQQFSLPRMIPLTLQGTSGNLLWKWGAEKIPAGEAINAKGLSVNNSYNLLVILANTRVSFQLK
jgi:hypothetical protein